MPRSAAPPYSILLADDHAFTLEGMRAAVDAHPGLTVAGLAPSGVQAIALARQTQPDLALLDYMMPDANGLEVSYEIRRWSPDTRVAIVTGTEDLAVLARMREGEIAGLFRKADAPSEILDGLMTIGAGGTALSASLEALAAEVEDVAALSAREREVLFAVARGLTNNGIATELKISPKTVESHRASLMRKLGVRSTAQLLIRAAKLGLLSY